MKILFLFVMLFACIVYAQKALPKKTVEDSVRLQDSRPLVLVDSVPPNIKALDDSVSTVNADPTLSESVRNTAIYEGLGIVGQSLKNSLSPNSIEADNAERELDYR